MEQLSDSNTEQHSEIDETLCVNCYQKPFQTGYATRLCADCRQAFIKYPIPKWIIYFSIGILITVVISLVRTTEYISAAVHLGRAEKAIDHKKFKTAQNELQLVLKKFPDDVTTNGNMIIAGSYNNNVSSVQSAYLKIADKNIEDSAFYNRITVAINRAGDTYSYDTVMLKKVTGVKKDHEKLVDYIINQTRLQILLSYI